MNGHPSAIELDEIAAGAGRASARVHADSCGFCRERVAALVDENRAARASLEFAAGRARLARTPSRQRLPWLLPAGALAGLGAALLIVSARGPAFRGKGGPALALVGPGGQAVSAPKVGATVELRIAPAGHRYVLVGALAAGEAPSVLWPLGGRKSGEAGAPISLQLAVTPGAVRVIALFSDRPLEAAALAAPPAEAELRTLDVVPAQ